MNIVFFGFGTLSIAGGYEYYLIDTAIDIKRLHPRSKVTIITATTALTEKYYKSLSAISFKKFDTNSLERESIDSIKQKLDDIRYVQFNTFTELKQLLSNADVIYSKNEIIELSILKLLNRKISIPIITGAHTPIKYPLTPTWSSKLHNTIYTSPLYKYLLKQSAAIKVNNIDDYIYIKKRFKLRNVGVLHHGFEVPTLYDKYSKNGLNILFAGRLTEQKGMDILIKVIEGLRHNSNIRFKIAGSGEDTANNLMADIDKKYSHVTYLGHVQKMQMKDMYRWSDIIIIPSKFETLNKVAVEGGLYSRVVISSDIPGPREVIVNELTGFLVKPEAPEFISKIKYLDRLKTIDIRAFKKLGFNAREKIEADFNSEVSARILYKTFEFLQKVNV